MADTNFQKLPQSESTQGSVEDCISPTMDKKPINWTVIVLVAVGAIVTILTVAICGYTLSIIIQMKNNHRQNIIVNPSHFNKPTKMIDARPPAEYTEQVTSPPPQPKLASLAKVSAHPANKTANYGDKLTMSCQFDRRVQCVWMRRSNEVDISGRYSYNVPRMDDGGTDCSFTIEPFRQLDIGEWQCIGVFEDQSSIATSTAKLALPQEGVSLVVSPVSQSVSVGSPVSLRCSFNTGVECVWLRRGEHIEVSGRYSYLTPPHTASGQGQTDCSLTIAQVKPIDVGQWVCSSMGDSASLAVMSNPVTITLT